MSHDIIELIKYQVIQDYEDQIAYYKELSNAYKAISYAKGPIHDSWRDERLIDYILTLPDGYNKRYNNILSDLEESVDYLIERWKANGINLDKVDKYEKVIF